MMVRPMINSLSPSAWARLTALSTSQRAPRISRGQAADDQQQIDDGVPGPVRLAIAVFPGVLLLHFLVFLAALADEKHSVGNDASEQQQAFQPADLAVEAEQVDQQGDADHDRHVEPHQLLRDHQRDDGRREAQDEEDVEDVAADDVAQGDVSLAGKGRLHADGQLRRAGAEGHHCQSR